MRRVYWNEFWMYRPSLVLYTGKSKWRTDNFILKRNSFFTTWIVPKRFTRLFTNCKRYSTGCLDNGDGSIRRADNLIGSWLYATWGCWRHQVLHHSCLAQTPGWTGLSLSLSLSLSRSLSLRLYTYLDCFFMLAGMDRCSFPDLLLVRTRVRNSSCLIQLQQLP